MKTERPISTISFNTENHLKSVLNRLVESEKIEYGFYIMHYAEENEKKNHFHVYMQPSKAIDLQALRKEFNELDFSNSKPLGCLPIEKSKFDDWYLYGLHDPYYLASKGLFRDYHYKAEDVITTDDDVLDYLVNNIKTKNRYQEMDTMQRKGITFEQYVILKDLNPMQISGYREAWNLTKNVRLSTKTKKREVSTPLIDTSKLEDEI